MSKQTDLVSVSQGSVSGDLSFGDNDKAIFGAGSDLQIWHDSATSRGIIRELGAGSLEINATNFVVKNAADTKNMIFGVDSGAITLYYDNNAKLATTDTGIDVTGTVVSDGLTVDTSSGISINGTGTGAIHNINRGTGAINLPRPVMDIELNSTGDAANNFGPSLRFRISDTGVSNSELGGIGFLRDGGDGSGKFVIGQSAEALQTSRQFSIASNGDISFYEDTGTTPKFFWDASAEALGIGVTPEAWDTDVKAIQIGGLGSHIAAGAQSAGSWSHITNNVYRNGGEWRYIVTDEATRYEQINGNHIWSVASSGTADTVISFSEAMRIDSSGGLLVGTTSGLGYGPHQIQSTQSSGGIGVLVAYNASTTDASNAINAIKGSSTTSSNARFIQFYANAGGTPMGGIVGNGASNVQFGSISDVREKTNIQSISGSLNKIIALNPVEFDWITNGEHVSAGFVAQEVEQIFPEFVIENMANDGQEERKGLTGGMTGGIVAHLVKAIQEQQQQIETLKARVAALEAV